MKFQQNGIIYKAETDLQISKINIATKAGKDRSGAWDEHTHTHTHTHTYTTIYKMDYQQGPIVHYRESYSIFCDNLHKKRICKRMKISICVTESLYA